LKRSDVKFWQDHTNITITVPKSAATGSAEGKALLNSFFQFLVDAGMQHNMEEFADWAKVRTILEALE
jgi:hypothetical protein